MVPGDIWSAEGRGTHSEVSGRRFQKSGQKEDQPTTPSPKDKGIDTSLKKLHVGGF